MAWRIDKEIVRGWVDNTEPGKVTGEIFFEGWDKPMRLELEGNCHRDLAGSRCEFKNDSPLLNRRLDINPEQIGKVGDMTAGLEPRDYVGYPYLEWYGDRNGRVVVELDSEQIQVIGTPIPSTECEPISRKEQNTNLFDFAKQCAKDIGIEK